MLQWPLIDKSDTCVLFDGLKLKYNCMIELHFLIKRIAIHFIIIKKEELISKRINIISIEGKISR